MYRDKLNMVLRSPAEKYTQIVREQLGAKLVSVALFGSVARGEVKSGSDIDLLLVCTDLPKGMVKRHPLLRPVREHSETTLKNSGNREYAPISPSLSTQKKPADFT